jgi:ribosomal protein L3 glutamine methyltransferase
MPLGLVAGLVSGWVFYGFKSANPKRNRYTSPMNLRAPKPMRPRPLAVGSHRSKHSRARTTLTVAMVIARAAERLRQADLVYGHGTDNAHDEAAALVFSACGYAHEAIPQAYAWPVPPKALERIEHWLTRRIHERMPSAYLTGVSSFAGLWLATDTRALVPRSPLAEFIQEQCQPFIDPTRVKDVLDVGTGSGCIALALAHYFADCVVDAADVSLDALALCADNIARLGLTERVRPIVSDVYSGVAQKRYDIIMSNPPYVPTAVVDALPAEYAHEPRLGLEAGADGLSIVRQLLAGAADHLKPGGLLVVEVGETQSAVMATWPTLPFLWLSFHNGGDGVFVLTREQCLNGR